METSRSVAVVITAEGICIIIPRSPTNIPSWIRYGPYSLLETRHSARRPTSSIGRHIRYPWWRRILFQERKDILSHLSADLPVHGYHDIRPRIVQLIVWSATAGYNFAVGRRLRITLRVKAKPGVTEVTRWLTAPDILVVLNEIDGLGPGELVGDLEFGVHSGNYRFFRDHVVVDWS